MSVLFVTLLTSFDKASLPDQRQRKPGGEKKKKKVTETHPQLLDAIKKIVGPVTRGDPMNPLKRTGKIIRNIVAALQEQGHHRSLIKSAKGKRISPASSRQRQNEPSEIE